MPILSTSFKNLLLLVLLLGSFNSIFAQDPTECPYFSIETTDTTGVSLALLSTDVDATISGVIANVIVEQTYFNAGDSIIDATYVFPMSNHAAIYAMEMHVNDRIIKAVIKEKSVAQEIFDTANESGQTASLLEQDRPNVFQMSLANIRSTDTIKVIMTYTELMIPRNGIYQFVFPNIVGPRYTTGGEPWVGTAFEQLQDVSETALNIDLKINAGMPVLAECSSHSVQFENEVNSTTASLSTNPAQDFIVDYKIAREEIYSGLILYEEEDENFFLSIIQPPRQEVEFDSPPREYIFLMDVSGSMLGEPLDISKNLISNLLYDLNYDDKFNIVFFAGSSSVLSESSLPVTNQNINMAVDHLEQLQGGGGTNLLPAMQRALDMEIEDDFSRTFVILTDGFVTVEKEAFQMIRENLNEANFFSFGIGGNVNRHIIDGLAYVGEGEAFVATDFSDATEATEEFKEYIEQPALTNIQTSFSGVNLYDVEPLTIPDVFAQRPIIIYGKYDELTNGSITVEGEKADESFSQTFNFEDYNVDTYENIAIKYLWARKKIKLMSDYGIADNPNDTLSIQEEITQLGLKYSLVTEFTSFVAVDSTSLAQQEESGDDDDNDGNTVSTEFEKSISLTQNSYIEVLGVIDQERVLRFQLKEYEKITSDKVMIQITDISGRILFQEEIYINGYNGEIIELLLNGYPSGIFTISMIDDSKVINTKPFVIAQ